MNVEEKIVNELADPVQLPVKNVSSEMQNSRDSGYDGNNTSVEKGSNIVIQLFQPLNPILDNNVMQSSAIIETRPQNINISSIHGTANDFNNKSKNNHCLFKIKKWNHTNRLSRF